MNTFRLQSFTMVPFALALCMGCGEDAPPDVAATGGTTGAGTGGGQGTGGTDPGFAAGVTYRLEIGPTWQEPEPTVGNEMGNFVPEFLFTVESVAADGTAQVLVGTANDGVQDMCNLTARATATVSPFTLLIAGLRLRLVNERFDEDPSNDLIAYATVTSLSFSNIIPDLGVGELQVTMDAREVAVLFHSITDPTQRTGDNACQAVSDFSTGIAQCQPCADGLAYCLTLRATRLGALAFPGGPVVPVDTAACPVTP